MTNSELIHLAHTHEPKQIHTDEDIHRNLDKKSAAAQNADRATDDFLSS